MLYNTLHNFVRLIFKGMYLIICISLLVISNQKGGCNDNEFICLGSEFYVVNALNELKTLKTISIQTE